MRAERERMAGGGARGKRARRGGGDGRTISLLSTSAAAYIHIHNLRATLGMQAHAALHHAPALTAPAPTPFPASTLALNTAAVRTPLSIAQIGPAVIT